ncbi:uncharacterized protein F4817DRAFT_365684 [Daldinia loculata]|uniref:uncharacterized protein n=1 Tax=Daldinia loculata TaxID=103429 RepID=UPI0020C5469F|nr:uncharacterized protein F4817DRAFT_365684 [Daldinia loculata]KAI1646836.1 hypothetical protein F4817DRAFT_365684 [Daldinia loculata]
MCYHVTLEICCEEEFSNSFPNTLLLVRFFVLCHAARIAWALQELEHGGPPRPPMPLVCIKNCPNYDPEYIRLERVFFTRCENCVKTKGPEKYGLNDDDMPIIIHRDRLLRDQLHAAVALKPYDEVVLRLYTDFNIHQRWILSGSRWIVAHIPIGGNDPLGPNPTYDLEGVRWWLEQRIGGIRQDVLDWLKSLPPSTFGPDEPQSSSVMERCPSLASESPLPDEDLDSLFDGEDDEDDEDEDDGDKDDEDDRPRSRASVNSDSSMEGYEWYDNWAEHHAYLPAKCTYEEFRALQASRRQGNSQPQGLTGVIPEAKQ